MDIESKLKELKIRNYALKRNLNFVFNLSEIDKSIYTDIGMLNDNFIHLILIIDNIIRDIYPIKYQVPEGSDIHVFMFKFPLQGKDYMTFDPKDFNKSWFMLRDNQ